LPPSKNDSKEQGRKAEIEAKVLAKVEVENLKDQGMRLMASWLGLNLDLNLPLGLNLDLSIPLSLRPTGV
jgi:hypothetical protein